MSRSRDLNCFLDNVLFCFFCLILMLIIPQVLGKGLAKESAAENFTCEF